RLDVLRRVPPISPGVEIPEVQLVLETELDPSRGARDLPRHARLAPPRTLVVEQDPVAREESVRLTVVARDVVREHLRARVRRPGVERRRLPLRDLDHLPVHLRGARLVELRRDPR